MLSFPDHLGNVEVDLYREPKPKAVEKLSKDAIERKVKGLLQELFHNKDPKEALVAFR